MLWVALHLPALSLEAFEATLTPEARQAPVALLQAHAIAQCNAPAWAAGIKPGLKRSTALALAPHLVLGQADAQRDALAQAAVAHAALAFTPCVTLEGSDVLLEVHASLRYFGGAARLLQRLQQALAPLQHRVQLASAPTALGALCLARWRDDLQLGPHSQDKGALLALLNRAPLGLLGPAQAHVPALQAMGLRTLGDLRQLPRAGLARRFGADLLTHLDRALGLQADPRDWLQLPERFEQRLELFSRADSTEQVLQGATLLLARLVAWAQAQHARVGCFELHLLHEARHRLDAATHTVVAVALAQPSLDPIHLHTLLRERLGRSSLAAPTLELRLCCAEVQRGAPPNGELFPTPSSQQEGVTRLIERLQARLGRDQVLQLQPQADHRPERSCGLQAWDPPAATGRAALLPMTGQPPPRLPHPAWLLPEPQALTERDDSPVLEGQVLRLVAGPERIEAGWWDGAPVARDYYIAMRPGGALVWVFRGRLGMPTAGRHTGWFLQGRFA